MGAWQRRAANNGRDRPWPPHHGAVGGREWRGWLTQSAGGGMSVSMLPSGGGAGDAYGDVSSAPDRV
jgi:hypothetical protein